MMKNALCNSRHRRTCRLAALMNVTLESVASCQLLPEIYVRIRNAFWLCLREGEEVERIMATAR